MTLSDFVNLVDVESNFVFLPRNGMTFCNCYAKVILAYLGVDLPNMTANNLAYWFSVRDDWTKDPGVKHDAVVAIVKGDPHGHIAVCVDEKNGIYTAAGARNRKFCTIGQTFGKANPIIWYHKS